MGGGRTLVTGGEVVMAQDATPSCEVFTVESKQWRMVAPMRRARYSHAQVELKSGRVLVCGGCDNVEDTPTASVEIYSPKHDVWIEAAPMPEGIWLHQAIVAHDGLVIVGGGQRKRYNSNNPGGLYLYDPVANAWSTIPSSITMAHTFGTIERIFFNSEDVLNVIYARAQFLLNYKTGTYGATSQFANTVLRGPFGDLVIHRKTVRFVTGGWPRKHLDLGYPAHNRQVRFLFLVDGTFFAFEESMTGERTGVCVSKPDAVRWSRRRHKSLTHQQRRQASGFVLALLRAGVRNVDVLEKILEELHTFELTAR